jgi:hypothetical protein
MTNVITIAVYLRNHYAANHERPTTLIGAHGETGHFRVHLSPRFKTTFKCSLWGFCLLCLFPENYFTGHLESLLEGGNQEKEESQTSRVQFKVLVLSYARQTFEKGR